MRRALAALIATILLGGCALGELLADYGDPVTLKPEQLVGVWVGDKRALEFTADGKFIADNLPRDAFRAATSDSPQDVPLAGEGTWKIDGAKLDLSFTKLDGESASYTHHLNCVRQEGVVYLVFFHVGSGGNTWSSYQHT